MHYYDHALLSAKKFNCNVEDTLKLHKIMDSSKNYFQGSQHRLFSHNQWFISVVTDLVGDVILNTKTQEMMSVRDILFEHLREDHNGEVPSLRDWLECVRIEVPDKHTTWFNHPRSSDKVLLKTLKKVYGSEDNISNKVGEVV